MGVSLFMFGVPGQIFRNMRISFTPEVAFPRNFVKAEPMVVYLIILATLYKSLPIAIGMESDGELRFWASIDNQIILEYLVMTAMKQKRRLTSVENIAESCTRTEVVVTVHTENADMVVGITLHVVEIVISDNISANGVVSSGIDSA